MTRGLAVPENSLTKVSAVVGPAIKGSAPSPRRQVAKALKDFKGAAAGLRFADEGIELSFAGGGMQQAGDGKVADHVGALPADTAACSPLRCRGCPEDLGGAKGSPFAPMQMLRRVPGLDLPQDHRTRWAALSIILGADAAQPTT